MAKLKKLIFNFRVLLLLFLLVAALTAMNPNPWVKGVTIRNIVTDSAASDAGMQNLKSTTLPRARERILLMNNKEINNIEEYYDFVSTLSPNQSVQIKTNLGFYRLTTKPILKITQLNETEEKTVQETIQENKTINGTTQLVNKTINKTITVNKTRSEVIGMEDLGFDVYDAPTTNIRQGLDLQGGTRVLLKPAEKVSPEDMDIIITNMNERLNVYGLSDIVIRTANDLVGQQYISVEIAGVSEKEIKELLAKQGKFEAKISNNVVFIGGEKDITYVCRTAQCSGIDPNYGCSALSSSEWACRFQFAISLSPDAAQRQADITGKLSTTQENGQTYLNETLDLYLDDVEVDSLNIGASLKGRASTDISISGSGSGSTQQEATYNSLEQMRKLQTVLITGSLPVKLEIVKADTISPLLGKELLRNGIFVGLLSLLAVSLVIFLRYRMWQVALPIIFTVSSEVVLLLGVASLIGWNIDLAAIAAIIVAAGTGVDDQIVITDETISGSTESAYGWKEKLKRAFFIIMAAYVTTFVAMIPLWWAGAGLLKGFAVITIIGISIGVFITRPTFAAVIEILLNDY